MASPDKTIFGITWQKPVVVKFFPSPPDKEWALFVLATFNDSLRPDLILPLEVKLVVPEGVVVT